MTKTTLTPADRDLIAERPVFEVHAESLQLACDLGRVSPVKRFE